MKHQYTVVFPQFEEVKKHVQENQQLYIGLGVGLLLGFYLKERSCETRVLRVYTM